MQHEQFGVHAECEQTHWWFTARRRILAEVLEAVLPDGEKSLVVDVGCGTGGNSGRLQPQYRCVGLDPSGAAIELARRRFGGVRFVVGDSPAALDGEAVRALAFLLTDVLEHVEDDFLMLSQWLTAAQPGAYFLITVPAEMALWSKHDESHGHYRRYDRARFEELWEGLPVTPLLVSYFNARLYPLVKAVRTINRWRGRSYGAADTDLKLPSRPVNWLLERIFAGEQKRLLDVLRGRKQRGYRRGVSLIALLRREPGVIVPRKKPDDVTPDCFDPEVRSPRDPREGPFASDEIPQTTPGCSSGSSRETWSRRSVPAILDER